MSDRRSTHYYGDGCDSEHGRPLLPKQGLPEPPAPPEDCCYNAEWRGRLCSYHQGFEDGWEALRAVVEG